MVWQYAIENPNRSQNTAQFVQIPTYTYDTGLLDNTTSPFYRKLSGKEENMADKLIKQAYTGKSDGDLDFKKWWWIDDVYKTNLYIPKSNDIMAPAVGGSDAFVVGKQDYETSIRRQERLRNQQQMEENKKYSGAITGKAVYNQ